jgi:hypothetical protein
MQRLELADYATLVTMKRKRILVPLNMRTTNGVETANEEKSSSPSPLITLENSVIKPIFYTDEAERVHPGTLTESLIVSVTSRGTFKSSQIPKISRKSTRGEEGLK